MRATSIVNVAELLRRPATRKEVSVAVAAPAVNVIDTHVPEGAELTADLVLESMSPGITVTGTVRGPWESHCRRCLEPVGGVVETAVHEVYAHTPIDEDTFVFTGDQLDLGPLVVETVTVELPLAPLCRPDCAGLCPECGANRNQADCGHRPTAGDPRWAALDAFRPEEN